MKGKISVLGQTIHLKNHKPVLVAPLLKGTTLTDLGAFYAPYIPMIVEPKYKFSRAKWHQAYFNVKDYDEVNDWCAQHFGPHPKRPDAWSRWWHKFEDSILFRDKEDFVLFTLRWS